MGISAKKIAKRPAVFLDRDGTIIRQVELLHKPEELRLLPGSAPAIARLNRLGYLVIIITNQPVIARGIAVPEEIDHIHAVLIDRFKKRGAKIDAVYFCPHHPHGNIKKYRIVCRCRKPSPGMIFRAAGEHGVDLSKSFMIGDSTADVGAGNRAKIKIILVKTGRGGKDLQQHKGTPDFVAKDISGAVKIIEKIKKND